MILADQLDPETLGSLVALYEHSVVSQSAIWAINRFNQSGVEPGEVLASRIMSKMACDTEPEPCGHSSTNALIENYRGVRP